MLSRSPTQQLAVLHFAIWAIADATTLVIGDFDSNDAFDPSLEWMGFPLGTYDDLGSHAPNCGSVANGVKSWSLLDRAFGEF